MPSTPQQIAAGASCLDCQIPVGLQWPVLIAQWAEMAGVAADAQALVDSAKCMACIPPGMQMQVMIYLLSQIAGITDVQTIMENAKCFSCLPQGMEGAAMIYLTDQLT